MEENSWTDVTNHIICASGVWDTTCDTLREPQLCESLCAELCGDTLDGEVIATCLTNDVFLCCTFAQDQNEYFYTTTFSTSSPSTRSAITWQNDYASSASDWTAIRSAHAILQMQDTVPPGCRAVDLEVSAQLSANHDPITQSVPISFTDATIMIPMLGLFQAIAPTPADSPIFGLASLTTACELHAEYAGTLVTTRTSMRYRAASACKAVQDCETCVQTGCTFCDWSTVSNLVLPPTWVPEWQWVQGAIVNRVGLCGVHRTICAAANGVTDSCGITSPSNIDSLYIVVIIAGYCVMRAVWYILLREESLRHMCC